MAVPTSSSILVLSLLIHLVAGQYEYAAVCLPTHRADVATESSCIVYLHCGPVPADVVIWTLDYIYIKSLDAGSTDKLIIDSSLSMFPTDGAESKAIRVRSTAEIQVLVYKDSLAPTPYNFNEVYQVPLVNPSSTHFFTSGYNDMTCGSLEYANQFYLLSSFSDVPTVTIKQQDGTSYEIQLPVFGTYVQVSYSNTDTIASGTEITSTAPITVVSGNLCHTRGSFVSNVPPVSSLTEQYMVPRLISQHTASPGFSMQVVATENDTVVNFDGDEVSLPHAGNDVTFELFDDREWMFLNCSRKCLSVQYTKTVVDVFGLFMLHMLSEHDFYTSVFFTTVDVHPTSYISLVVVGEAPGVDILLDGSSLEDLDWGASDGYATAETAISQGAHVLESDAGRPFAAYVYTHSENETGAAGYTLLLGDYVPSTTVETTVVPSSSPPPSSSTTPPPSNALPQLSVRINGTVYTEDGTDITQACAQVHSQSLDAKSDGMIVEVNRAIGTDICVDSPEVVVSSSTALMIFNGPMALLDIRQIVQVESGHLASELESCSSEILAFLSDYSHWPQPIFPDEPGCSRLLFVPPGFDAVGSYWNCNNQEDGEDLHNTENQLLFRSHVSDVLRTVDGSALNVDCTVAYGDMAEQKNNAMVNTISAEIVADSQCTEKISIVSQTTGFSAFGDQAYFQASFYYSVSNSASFDEFLACALPLHVFSLQHENWGTQPGSPFLPTPPGCPALEHEPPTLDDEGYRWNCVDIA